MLGQKKPYLWVNPALSPKVRSMGGGEKKHEQDQPNKTGGLVHNGSMGKTEQRKAGTIHRNRLGNGTCKLYVTGKRARRAKGRHTKKPV